MKFYSVAVRLYIVWILMVVVSLTWCGRADAKVSQLSLELKRMPFNRDFLFPDRTEWEFETSLLMDVSIGRWFMESDLTGRTAGSRYRYVGWQYTTGLRVAEWLDVIWDHHSEHAIDYERAKFPVRDGYGIRLNFVEK